MAKKIVEDYVGSSLGGSSRSLKAALDAVNTKIGNDTMGTTASSVTGAIAEHESDINGADGINGKIGNTAMGTTATTLTGAVKEHNDKIGSTTMGTTATTLTGAIAEHEEDISELNSKLSGISEIQTGFVNVARASGRNTASVTFPRPFTTQPNVLCFVHGNQPQTFFCSADNVTTTGFQANLYNTGAAISSNVAVRYIAIL